MADWPKFPRAPITEALLDIRTKLAPSITLQHLAGFQETIRGQYPNREERTSWRAGIEVKPGGASFSSGPSPNGYLFSSADGRQMVQARFDGFTFNRLRPYDRWETFRKEARYLWSRFGGVAAPEDVSRIALRYINRIELPFPVKDFKEYIRTFPDIAPQLPRGLAGFLVRLNIPDNKSKAVAIVTETMENPAGGVLPLILDIDVVLEERFEAGDKRLWVGMERLRDFKNRIFFFSLTKRAKELFK